MQYIFPLTRFATGKKNNSCFYDFCKARTCTICLCICVYVYYVVLRINFNILVMLLFLIIYIYHKKYEYHKQMSPWINYEISVQCISIHFWKLYWTHSAKYFWIQFKFKNWIILNSFCTYEETVSKLTYPTLPYYSTMIQIRNGRVSIK